MLFTRFALIALLSLSLVACHCVKQNIHAPSATGASPYFSLINATSQRWLSPLPGGGDGMEYYFTLKLNTNEELSFDSAWLMNKRYALFVIKQGAPVSNGPIRYGVGDTVNVRISARSANSQPDVQPPLSYEGDALLRYQAAKEQQYFIVNKITKLNTPPRQ